MILATNPGLALTLLGQMALRHDSKEVVLPPSRKTRALLAYLVTCDRPVRRERLCEMFWDVPDDPRGSLRWSLSKLRGLIDDGERCRVVADRETVGIDCDLLVVDWRAFRQAALRGFANGETSDLILFAEAAAPFLEGLDLPRCDIFQAWLVAMRGEVRKWRIDLLGELSRRVLDSEAALAVVRQWVSLDPYDTAAQLLFVERLHQAGRHEEAAWQRDIAIQILEGDGVSIPTSLRSARPEESSSQPDLPHQQVRFCTASDGTALAYSATGSGIPLVKAANWLNHLEHDWNSPVWRHWLRAITDVRQLVRYDGRGNGLSDWQVADISFDAMVDDLSSVVDHANLEQFDLLGISQGCSVSIAYAVRHPARVRRLILYGGYAAGWKLRELPGEKERREAMLTLTREGWGQNNPAFRQIFTTLFFPEASSGTVDWFNELQRVSTSPANAERLQRAFADIDVRPILRDVRVPTLVLHASDDAVIPYVAGRALAMEIPGAELVTLDSRNHLVLEEEAAWPIAIERIAAFLA